MRIREFKTEKATVYASAEPTADQKARIDDAIGRGYDALVMGTFPQMSLGFVDPRDWSCAYPLSNAFAVSQDSGFRMDKGLGCAAAAELSARIRESGGKVGFAGDILLHSGPENAFDITDALVSCVLCDAKYRGGSEFRASSARLMKAFRQDPALGNHSRKKLMRLLPSACLKILWYRTLGRSRTDLRFRPDFREMLMRGSYCIPGETLSEPLVSVVIRTYRRPGSLRKTLECLRYQAYGNTEYIVVEDGQPLCREMIASEFPDLQIRYKCMECNGGRSAVANAGFAMASGKYINMLDDDDYFYPEHITAGVAVAESGGYDMVFLQGLALLITPESQDPYRYEINDVQFMNYPRIDPFAMTEKCLTPNNGVLFRRSLYEELGGMREDLDAHEDWHLWLKYMTKAKWTTVPCATSCFANPFSEEEQRKRKEEYARFDSMQYDDPALVYSASPDEIRSYYRGFIGDWHYLGELGMLEQRLRKACEKYGVGGTEEELAAFGRFTEAAASEAPAMRFTAKDYLGFYKGCLAKLASMAPAERTEFLNSEYRRVF